MYKFASVILTAALLIAAVPVVGIAQVPYFQDFEALAPVDGSLAGDNWLVYGNVFDPGWNWLWGHGPWPAPNNQTPGNWEDIVSGQGGPEQGEQQIVVYSDFQNGEHANGNWVESNLFQEQTLPVGATGIWEFTFDAKMGDLVPNSTAQAFIKTLDPNAGWTMTNFVTEDMTTTPVTWSTYTLSIDVTGLDNQVLQFGFMNYSTNYTPCGIYYDNVNFGPETTPVEEATWGAVKALYR
jgi:hypothetical protein